MKFTKKNDILRVLDCCYEGEALINTNGKTIIPSPIPYKTYFPLPKMNLNIIGIGQAILISL